jgi:uncharacterized protein (DUF433 family)/DNA-binding transcriptional MerR regulator
MFNTSEYLGCGLYSLADAAWLLRLSPITLRYWAGERSAESMVSRQFKKDHLLTFAELMELQFVKLFRDAGVSLQAIRAAAAAAAKMFHTAYPFTVKRFDTDGKTIFATLKSHATDKVLTEDLKHGQYVFTKVIRPFFKKLEYRGANEAERFWPLQKRGRIVLDPNRKFGQPIDAETGVPTQAIISALKAGKGQDAPTVAKWLGVPLEAVKAAHRFDQLLST